MICSTNPLSLKENVNFGGGIGMIEMLYKSKYLALVGGGKNPKWPPNHAVIWDMTNK